MTKSERDSIMRELAQVGAKLRDASRLIDRVVKMVDEADPSADTTDLEAAIDAVDKVTKLVDDFEVRDSSDQ